MNKTLINSPNLLQTPKNDPIVKLLLFSVGSLSLALTIDTVKKILTYKPVYGSGLSYFGIAHIGAHEITVLDLHRRLFQKSQEEISGQKGYLIMARSSRESFGIWVGEAPTLIDVPLSMLRILPESYRRSDTLSVASHVLVLPQIEESLTVFLLDIECLLEE